MSKFRTLVAAFGLIALSQAPAHAASQMTEAFLANVAANLGVLSASSRLAANHSRDAEWKAYAASESAEASKVAMALSDATPSDVRSASADTELAMTSGRSVAVAGMTGRVEPASEPSVLEAANSRLPPTAELAKLATLHGAAFDRMFFVIQLDALSQIESDYRTYITQGDDPAVAKLAHERLPELMRRLEALTRA